MVWIVKYKDDLFLSGVVKYATRQECKELIKAGEVLPFPLDQFSDEERITLRDITTFFKDKAEKYGLKLPPRGSLKDYRYDRYGAWVLESETEKMKTFEDRYRVKFCDHFFEVFDSTEDEVMIGTNSHYLGELYGIREERTELGAGYWKWAKRSDITELSEVKERIGLHCKDHLHTAGVVHIIEERDDAYLIKTDVWDVAEPFVKGFELVKHTTTTSGGEENVEYEVISKTRRGEQRFITPEWKARRGEREFLTPRQKEIYQFKLDNPWEKKGDWYYKWVPKDEIFVYNETDEPLRY